ncbi:hypothetical protein ONZ45_g1454 [Pleurotus djamor]|nr:hypothetical protein ONZ45_g1454 [Pleurotus djamor]
MTLAQRLDELATANAEGRLNDDEYRLLRQNLFERYGSGAVVPGEVPVVPIAGKSSKHARGASLSSTSSSPRPQSIHVQSARISVISPAKQKQSGVTSFIRIATGKKDASTTESPKRSFVSRLLSRKGSKSLFIRTDLSLSHSTSRLSHNSSLPPSSPLNSPSRLLSPSTNNHSFQIDPYDDANLTTTQEIQQEISHVEAEYRNLLDAFNSLELTTLTRLQAQELRRLPVHTPTSPIVLMVGQDWRAESSDRLSIHSSSSVKSSHSSRSHSLFGHRKLPSTPTPQRGPSPLSHRRPPPSTNKSSISSLSLSSQSTSQLSSVTHSRLNLPPGSRSSVRSSRSAGHLPLSTLFEASTSNNRVDLGDSTEGPLTSNEEPAEVAEIKQRKADMSKRYLARLEYLRARLKSAQLHEKLLRK